MAADVGLGLKRTLLILLTTKMTLLIYTWVAFLKAARASPALLGRPLLEIHPVAPGLSPMQIWDCSPPGRVIPIFCGSSCAAEFSKFVLNAFLNAPKR